MKANKVRELKRLEQKVFDYEAKLNSSLQELAKAASLALGYEVAADLCNGGEIEFRRVMGDGVPDTDSCIYLEDILEQKGK